MPAINGVGWNRNSTPFKQFALDKAAGHLLGSAAAVARNRRTRCVVLDMTCGPGLDPRGGDGSPLILARHVTFLRNQGFSLDLVCIDQDHQHIGHLEELMAVRFPDLRPLYGTNQAATLNAIAPDTMGLSYWDPTRYNDLDAQLLAAHGQWHSRIDVLLTRECLAALRMEKAGLPVRMVDEYLRLTGKKCGYLMQYAKWGWWSFGFADNWVDRPANRMSGFYPIDSPRGQELLNRLLNRGEDGTPEQETLL